MDATFGENPSKSRIHATRNPCICRASTVSIVPSHEYGAGGTFGEQYLQAQRNASAKTVLSYRDTLAQFLRFAAQRHRNPITALAFERLDAECVLAFLEHIENERMVCIKTRNQRMAALRSFFRHAATMAPEHLHQCRRILAIPFKKAPQNATVYLERDEMAALLARPDRETLLGQRNHLMLAMMYNTGCRVQELVQIRPCDISIEGHHHVRLMGKGNKERLCPLWPQTVQLIKDWMDRRHLLPQADAHLFINQRGQPLTRSGVRRMLIGYCRGQQQTAAITTKPIHPHTLRHTTAVHLLQAGVELNMIREILGHVSIDTTNRYAEIDMAMKRQALKAIDTGRNEQNSTPVWLKEKTILDWLEAL